MIQINKYKNNYQYFQFHISKNKKSTKPIKQKYQHIKRIYSIFAMTAKTMIQEEQDCAPGPYLSIFT